MKRPPSLRPSAGGFFFHPSPSPIHVSAQSDLSLHGEASSGRFQHGNNVNYTGSLNTAQWGADNYNAPISGSLLLNNDQTTLVKCNPAATGEIVVAKSIIEKLRQAFQKVRIRFNRDDLKAYNSLSGFPIRQENWFDPWEFFKTYPIREVVRNGVVYRAEEFCC